MTTAVAECEPPLPALLQQVNESLSYGVALRDVRMITTASGIYVGGNVVDSTGSVVSHGDVWWSENGQLYALSGGARQWSPMLPDGREWASAGDEYGSQLVECVS